MPRSSYGLSPFAMAVLSSSIFTGFPRRALGTDATHLLNMATPRPLLTGVDHFPLTGGFTVIANHYQRDGLWIGWVGAMIAEAIKRIRGAEPPIRIIVTDAQRFQFRRRLVNIPLSGYFLKRVATFWGMIPISGDPRATSARASALKHALRSLKAGEPILIFPEGELGRAGHIKDALAGTGSFLTLASRLAPVFPVAFWEEESMLRGQVGSVLPASTFIGDDTEVRTRAMSSIKALLPPA